MKKHAKWVPAAVAGLAGAGIGYYFGLRARTTAPAGLASGTPTWPSGTLGSVSQRVWYGLSTVYGPSATVLGIARMWSRLNLDQKQQLVLRSVRANHISTTGLSANAIVGAIDRYVAAYLATPVSTPTPPALPSPPVATPSPSPSGAYATNSALSQVALQVRRIMATLESPLEASPTYLHREFFACDQWPYASTNSKNLMVSAALGETRSWNVGSNPGVFQYQVVLDIPRGTQLPSGINAGGFSVSQIMAEIDRQCSSGVPLAA